MKMKKVNYYSYNFIYICDVYEQNALFYAYILVQSFKLQKEINVIMQYNVMK